VTCHDPHPKQQTIEAAQRYRQRCNSCHADQQCGLALDQRIERADNDCTQCHMPGIESDVPHTSTTSHLIAVYDDLKPRGFDSTKVPSMRRVQRSPAVADELLARADVVAEALWAVRQAREGDLKLLETHALDEGLTKVLRGDSSDAEIHSLLARMERWRAERVPETPETRVRLDQQWAAVGSNAAQALQLESLPIKSREGSLEAIGNQLMRDGDYTAAARSFSELTRIRRSAVDWYNLGICFGKIQRLPDAERAFREAIRLDGTYVAPYRALAILYRSINPAASQQLAAIAQRLMQQ
jgi:hypothetical protein